MINITDKQFDQLIDRALSSLPGEHIERIENIAILRQDDPTPEQRQVLQLRRDQSLYGLYEGLPLPARQGQTRLVPDKITLFKNPLSSSAWNLAELQEQIRHTLWHEIGHYYGLDHSRIRELEK